MNLFGVGPTEILVILVVVLILFGPDRLPEIAKRIGGASRELKNNLDNINDQMNDVLETSMETDKARMTPPAETNVAPTAPAAPEPLPLPEPGNSILPPPRTEATVPVAQEPPANASAPPSADDPNVGAPRATQ